MAAFMAAACSDDDLTGAWAPEGGSCDPGAAGRIIIAEDALEQAVADRGPLRTFAVVRREAADNGDEWLRVWFEVADGPGSGIYRWTFQVLDADRLHRVEVALGSGMTYEPTDAPDETFVRCPDA